MSFPRSLVLLCLIVLVLGQAGCNSSSPPPATTSATTKVPETSAAPADGAADVAAEPESAGRPKRRGPIMLGSPGDAGTDAEHGPVTSESVVEALKPLQILLGKWNGTSRKALVDEPQWVWDFQTDPKSPALKLTSQEGEYLRTARLTYLPKSGEFQLTAVDADNQQRTYRGTFTEPVQDVPGDDNKLQRKYRLELTEADPAKPGEVWQLAFAQQENDRYLMEVNRKRGSGPFTRIDTVGTQREGTSFAISSTDYGDKTCVISQGLGTISVSYNGKSYWVCCTGCKAAFEEDPEKWIARYEAQKMKK